jgi:ATP-dependent Clp protease ATP-binding subunit ClpC
MTSNLGADVLRQRARKIGFSGPNALESGEPTFSRLDAADVEAVLKTAQKALPPELWGRVDEKCVFAPLGHTELSRIAQLLVDESSRQLGNERKITYEVTSAVIDMLLASSGSDPTLGARPLRRAVQRICETAVARAVLRGEIVPGDHLELQVYEGELIVVPVV